MAKKQKGSRVHQSQRHPRVRAPKTIRHPLPHLALTKPKLTLYQDNRSWHPERTFRPALSISRSMRGAVRTRPLTLSKPTRFQTPRLSESLKFPDPKRVLICIRRNQRKRVLHAKKVAGSGGLAKPRRNQWSDVSCSRH